MLIWNKIKNYVFLGLAIFLFFAGFRTHAILDAAALSKQQTKVIDSIPQVITKTQTITKVIHDVAKTNSCVNAPVPAAILDQLR